MTKYTHRNGETEPPTMQGCFWYRAEFYIDDDDEPAEFFHLFYVSHNVNEPGAWWAHDWGRSESRMRDTDRLKGQWWGPVMPPWEAAPAAQPSRIICAACNDYLDVAEPSYCNICYDTMESAARMQPWHPISTIESNGLGLQADDLAVTIGEGDTALATFVWPSEGDYAVCKRMQTATDTFAAFDAACGEELEFLLDDIMDKQKMGSDEWANAWVIRSTLTDARDGKLTQPDYNMGATYTRDGDVVTVDMPPPD